jgi:hypothetical protein
VSGILIQPNFHLTTRKRGRIVDERHVANSTYAAGRNCIRDLLLGRGLAPAWIALGGKVAGAGGALPAAGWTNGTSLEAERSRWACTQIRVAKSSVTYSMFLFEHEGNSATYYMLEAGIFAGTQYGLKMWNDTPLYATGPKLGGTMLCRATFAPILKTDQVTMTINWTFNVLSATT